MGAAVSLWCQEEGSIPGLAQWVEDPVLLQVCGLQLQLPSDLWPSNSICCRVARKGEKEGEGEKERERERKERKREKEERKKERERKKEKERKKERKKEKERKK